MIVNSAT